MAKRTPGLRKRNGIWHIDKTICGQKIRKSTGTGDLSEAERMLEDCVRDTRERVIFGKAERKTFDSAAARFLAENRHKKTILRDVGILERWIPWIGNLPLAEVHDGTIAPFLEQRRQAKAKAGTINREIATIRRILALSARKWRDEKGRPWLDTAPMLSLEKGEARKPHPLTFDEQTRLFQELPRDLAEMALFAVNTGLRDQEICGLRWEWEWSVSGTDYTVFRLPDENVKNGHGRIVPLNSVARSIVAARRGVHPDYVFSVDGNRRDRMIGTSWTTARKRAGLDDVRVHDLRHTFGMRLRAAGVGFEDRQDLLGHYAGRVTTHYSRVEIGRLIECVEAIVSRESSELTLLRIA